MEFIKTIVKNAFWNGTFQVLNVIINIILIPILIGYLGIQTYSTYIFHFSIVGLFSLLADFGQKSTIIFDLGETKNKDKLIFSFLKLQIRLFLITCTLYLTFITINSYDPRNLFFLLYFSYDFFYPNWLFVHLNKTQFTFYHSFTTKLLLVLVLITFKQFYSENLFGLIITISLFQFLPVAIGLYQTNKTYRIFENKKTRTYSYAKFSNVAAIKIFDSQYINIFNLVLSIYGSANTPALHDVITKITKPVTIFSSTIINSSLTSFKNVHSSIRFTIFALIGIAPVFYGIFLIFAYNLRISLITDISLYEILLATLALALLGVSWAIGDLIFVSNKQYDFYFKTGATRITVIATTLILVILVTNPIEIYHLYYSLIFALMCDIIYKIVLIYVNNRI